MADTELRRDAPAAPAALGKKLRWSDPLATVRARLLALMFLAALPALGFGALQAADRFRVYAAAEEAQARILLEAVVSRYRERLESVRGLLSTLSVVPQVARHQTECRTIMAEALRPFSATLTNISTLGADGRLTCSVRPAELGRSYADAPFFQVARQTGGLAFGSFTLGTISGEAVFIAAHALSADGRFNGTVGTGIRLLTFLEFGKPGFAPPGSAIVLRDGHGRTLAINTDGAPVVMPWPNAVAGGSILVDGPQGGMYFAARSLDANLGIGVAVPARAGAGPPLADVFALGGDLLLLFMICFGALLLGASIWVIEPIRALDRAVRQARRSGRVAVPRRLSARFPRELRSLQLSFDRVMRVLKRREDRVSQLADQRATLLREVHHRVKNSLQIVSSVLSLQERRTADAGAKAALAMARDRIQAFVTLHRHLYANDDVRAVDMGEFVRELAAALTATLEDERRSAIRLQIEVEPMMMPPEKAVAVGLIVTEAAVNALKYAFPAGRRGLLRVALQRLEAGFRLVVADDGVGGDPVGAGLGTFLIQSLAAQLGGVCRIDRAASTTVTVESTAPLDADPGALPAGD